MKTPDHEKQKHPFQILDPSPWPMLSSFAVLIAAIGSVLYMHGIDKWLFYGGTAFLVSCLWLWWRDVISESKTYTSAVERGLRWGVIVLIFSEVMFFFGFFWGYFHTALVPPEVIGGVWPPPKIKLINPYDLPYLNTLILLLSSATLSWAHHSLLKDKKKEAYNMLLYTVVLGCIFVCLQALEYGHAAFSITEGIFPSLFYMLTGFHGIHVVIGTIFLGVCLCRVKSYTPTQHVGFEAAAWYWHFVDAVWILLFLTVYIYPY